MKYIIFITLMSLFNFPSIACSYVGYYFFQPTLERWEQHPGPKQLDENSDGTYWEAVPLPVVEKVKINRASYEGNSSCGDTGNLSIVVKLPKSSTYDLDEFGVYLRVIDGNMPDTIFPNMPIIPTMDRTDKKNMSFVFPWVDHHPSKQVPLNLTVEIRFVTNERTKIKSTYLSLSGGFTLALPRLFLLFSCSSANNKVGFGLSFSKENIGAGLPVKHCRTAYIKW